MTLKEIKELVALLAGSDISELEFERSGYRLRIRRGSSAAPHTVAPPPGQAAANSPPLPASAASQGTPTPPVPEAGPSLHTVKSPIVGTFYNSPSPDADPFVKVGDSVEKGKVLCIIEAMKLMNEIESDVAGEITEIFVESAQPVEYGEPLFNIRLRS